MSVHPLGRPRRAVLPSPLFLAFVAAALVGGGLAWGGDLGSRAGRFGVFVLVLAGWVVSVCLHEFAHAYLAYRAGDRSVEARGYLTLNPFKYAHPVLSILLPLVFIVSGGIGLPGGAVYLHPHAFRSRLSQSIASLAGPLTNVVMAAVLLLVAKPHVRTADLFISVNQTGAAASGHVQFWSALVFLGFLQITAAVLNLLPIPGLDGWAVIEPYLSAESRRFGDQVKPWAFIGIIVLFQLDGLREAFFRLVLHIFDLFGVDQIYYVLGRELFRFWTRNPFAT